MILVATGLVLVFSGAISIRFPELVSSLRKNDHAQWIALGSPSTHAFSKTIGVCGWVLEHGFENSQSSEVNAIGKQSLHRALFAKHALLIGVALVSVGFVAALFGF